MNEQVWEIELYTDRRGRSPVAEFLDGLPLRDRNDARNALRLLREFGIRLGMPHAKKIKGLSNIWELRAGSIRLFYVARPGRRFVVLHAFRKKSQKTPVQEILVAERRMVEVE